MTHTFVCPMCACQVTLNLDLADDFAYMKQIEAWCCTAHLKPVRMEFVDESQKSKDSSP